MDPQVQARMQAAISAGYDPQQVYQRAAQLGLISAPSPSAATPTSAAPTTGTSFVGNAISDAGDVVGGVANAVLHPINTIKNLTNLVGGVGEKVARKVDEGIQHSKGDTSFKGPVLPAEQMLNNVLQHYKDAYGSGAAISDTLQTHPISALMDTAGLLAGGEGVLGAASDASRAAGLTGVADTAGNAARVVGNVAEKVNPLKLVGSGASKAGKVTDAVGSQIADTGNRIISTQADLPRSAARAFQLQDTTNELANAGFTKLDDWQSAADKITGANGVMPKLVRAAVANAGPVDTNGILELAQEAGAHPLMPTGVAQKFESFVRKGLSNMYGGAKGSLATTAQPLDTFDFIQQLEKQAASITKGKSPAMIAPQDAFLAQSFKSVANELKNRLYTEGPVGAFDTSNKPITGAGADAVVAENLSPETIKGIQDLFPNNKKWQAYVTDKLSSAKSVADLRSFQRPFVNGQKIASETSSGSQMPGISLGGKGVGKVLNLFASMVPTDTLAAAGGNIARKAGEVVKNIPDIGNAAGSVLSEPALPAALSASNAATATNATLPANPSDVTFPAANATAPASSPTPSESLPAPKWSPEDFAKAIQWDMSHTGGANIPSLQAEYKVLGRPQLSADQTNQFSGFQNSLGLLDKAETMLKSGKVARLGPAGALLNRAEVKVGGSGETNSSAFDALIPQITTEYLAAMGGVRGVDSTQLRKALDTMLPDLSLSKEVNLQRINLLRQNIAGQQTNLMNTLNQYGSAANALPSSPTAVQF